MDQIVDLSHTLETGMPVYPDSDKPRIEQVADIATENYRESRLNMLTHTGTHIDCPAHLVEKGVTTDHIPVERFYGPGIVIDCRPGKSGKTIDRSFLQLAEPALMKAEFVLLYTGWSQLWNTPAYNKDFPLLNEDAASYLTSLNLKGIGFDTCSPDPVGSVDLPIHHILLNKNLILIENLTNLGLLAGKDFHFACFPLKISQGDGSPVRAVGIIDRDNDNKLRF